MRKHFGLLPPLVFPSLTCSQTNVQKQKSAAVIRVAAVAATAAPAKDRRRGDHRCGPAELVSVAVGKEMGDGDENHRAERRGRERIPETAAENSELHKNPAADKGADQSENNIRDTAKAAAPRDFYSEPAGDETDQNPIEKAVWKHGAEVPLSSWIYQQEPHKAARPHAMSPRGLANGH